MCSSRQWEAHLRNPCDSTRRSHRLVTAVHPWVAHRPQDLNQPRMSSGHTARNAAPIASETASVVRAAADRSHPLTFENISAIGVRSGLYGGNGIKLAPAPATA